MKLLKKYLCGVISAVALINPNAHATKIDTVSEVNKYFAMPNRNTEALQKKKNGALQFADNFREIDSELMEKTGKFLKQAKNVNRDFFCKYLKTFFPNIQVHHATKYNFLFKYWIAANYDQFEPIIRSLQDIPPDKVKKLKGILNDNSRTGKKIRDNISCKMNIHMNTMGASQVQIGQVQICEIINQQNRAHQLIDEAIYYGYGYGYGMPPAPEEDIRPINQNDKLEIPSILGILQFSEGFEKKQ